MKNPRFHHTIQRFQKNVNQAAGYKMVFGTMLALFVLAGLGSAQTRPSLSTAAVSPRQHAPMKFHGAGPSGVVNSENWSGFALPGSKFTFAKGSWHVPEVDCNKTPNTYSSFWVGIDGYSSSTLEQIGTESDCDGTTPNYYAWYEFLPADPVAVVITSVPVSPGDVIGASVIYSGGQFTLGIHDHTTGAIYSTAMAVPGAKRSSAEFIAEAPSLDGEILPLADFDLANFGQDKTGDPGTNYATDSTTKGPISHFGSRERINMVTGSGVPKATPTVLTKDGTSFTVAWKSE
jgi:Peptidase A4 family